jgi:formylglycine-generating enzyme required for sulfatase activity
MRLILCLISLLLFTNCNTTNDNNKEEKKISSSTDCHPQGGRSSLIAGGVTSTNSITEKNDTLSIEVEDADKTQFIENQNKEIPEGMVLIDGGTFMMGAVGNLALPREYPRHPVKVSSFYMDIHEVTNSEFNKFVDETGYVTIAERPIDWEELKKQLPSGTPKPPEKNLRPGSLLFKLRPDVTDLTNYFQWWEWTVGANWRHPEGPESNIIGKENHPVVHIAYADAKAYARWAGKRLPTEAEWEYAAKGGLEDNIYPWGNIDVNEAPFKCNFFQGQFPAYNSGDDGYNLSAPVGSFKPNGYGLYDMAGNVWEIVSDKFDETYYSTLPQDRPTLNPKGSTRSFYSSNRYAQHNIIKGGSFLCNDSYCASYRVSAKMPLEEDSAMNHVGFRCVVDVE